MSHGLQPLVEAMLQQSPHPACVAMAEHLRTRHGNVRAILAYGSALRDATPETTLIDLYVLTDTLADVSPRTLSRWLCGRLPPNVYYADLSQNGVTYRAKYAVLPVALLQEKVAAHTANPYFWARFAQPTQLVWVRDDATRAVIVATLATSMQTAAAHAKALAPGDRAAQQWQCLFQNTYRTELRPEDESRAAFIVERQRAHFEAISRHTTPTTISTTPWPTRRWQGKLMSLARLAKAAFTFQGGADYAAWKIKRHSGVEVEVKPWHRKHPVLAAIVMLPQLLRSGALK
jgi:hypothetical protein